MEQMENEAYSPYEHHGDPRAVELEYWNDVFNRSFQRDIVYGMGNIYSLSFFPLYFNYSGIQDTLLHRNMKYKTWRLEQLEGCILKKFSETSNVCGITKPWLYLGRIKLNHNISVSF